MATQRTTIKSLLATVPVNTHVCVKGWVRTKRASKQVIFITLNDGSTLENLQIVATPTQLPEAQGETITTGASLAIEGQVVASAGSGQKVELQATKITLLGTAVDYPLQPKHHSFEFLRKIGHLRFRTNTFGAVFRLRHAISFAIHQFFHDKGFTYLHSPIITSSDAEGAGEMFRVTNLNLNRLPKDDAGRVDDAQDFFGQTAHLTVSGQLAGEAAMMGLGAVYTFGPTFRAENSNTSRHLAEFWMLEPEVAFNDLADNIALAKDFLCYLIQFVLKHCPTELEFLHQRELKEKKSGQRKATELSLFERLALVAEQPFEQITYTEAIDILKASQPNRKGKFAFPIKDWGADLQSEHECYLVEKHFKKPVVIIDYPREIKAFYMRQNDDEQTVAAVDVLFPGIGEIIGGSQREERLELLTAAMERLNIVEEHMSWYLDTRRFGTVPHSGFGLGLDRFVQFVTGMENIRDVIPFPRTPGHVAC